MRRPTFRLFPLLLTITSCLGPMGENFVDIEKPEPSQITLELSGITNDTILIDRTIVFAYELNGYPLKPTEIDVHIGSKKVFATTSWGNTFEVNPSMFPSGYHTMTISIVARTENGSLANRLDEEYLEISRRFSVIIDNTPAQPAEIIKLDSANGVLTVYWNKYSKPNFTRYEVTRLCFDGRSYSSCGTTTLTTARDTSWTDPAYVGGKVAYRVDIVSEIGITRGIQLEYDWQPKIVITMEDGYPTMSWSRPLYYAHSVGYRVTPGIGFPFDATLADTSHAPSDRASFGFNYDFLITIKSDIQRMSAEFKKQYYVGTRKFLPSVVPFLYNSKENLYYGRQSPGLVVMDANLDAIASTPKSAIWKISPNGEYFIAIIGNDLHRVDPLTLETTRLLHVLSMAGNNHVVADNGLIGCQTGIGYRVLDLNTGQEKYIDDSTPYQNLSPSGNYLIRSREVLHFDGTSFVYEGDLPSNFGLNYIFDENDDLIASHGYPTHGFATFDIETRTMTWLEGLGNAAIPWLYDPVSNKTLINRASWYYIFNPATNKTDPVTSSSASIFNGRLFAQQGNYVYAVEHTFIE